MAIEVLKEIREAEIEAKNKIESARNMADEITRKAAVEAEKILADSRQESSREAEQLMSLAEKEAAAEIATMKDQVAQQAAAIRDKARSRMDKAVPFIVERIVTARGRR